MTVPIAKILIFVHASLELQNLLDGISPYVEYVSR